MDVGKRLAQGVPDLLLVVRVDEREEQADGHRLDPGRGDLLDGPAHAVAVELEQDALRADPLRTR